MYKQDVFKDMKNIYKALFDLKFTLSYYIHLFILGEMNHINYTTQTMTSPLVDLLDQRSDHQRSSSLR